MSDAPAMPTADELGEWVSNQTVVEGLQKAILSAPRDLRMVRQGLAEVLRRDPPAFTRRFDPHRGRVWRQEASDFLAFVTQPVPDGLGSDPETMRRLLMHSPEELALFDLAVARGRGNPTGANQHTKEGNGDIVTLSSPSPAPAKKGNSAEYAHRRLARERPDLLEEVKAGKTTPHGAMVKAGFRKNPTPYEQVMRLLPKLTDGEREMVARECRKGKD